MLFTSGPVGSPCSSSITSSDHNNVVCTRGPNRSDSANSCGTSALTAGTCIVPWCASTSSRAAARAATNALDPAVKPGST